MKNEPLLELIQSLTMSEKRFFKIFSQRHIIGEKNQYLQLFDFIDKKNTLDNQTLLKQSFVNNLSAEKNYLFRLILKSLNTYYYEYSYKLKVQNYISNAEILAYKGIELQAIKLLNKAEKLATEAELFPQLITIKQTQFEIFSKLNEYNKALEALRELDQIQTKNKLLINVQYDTTQLYKKRQEQGGIRNKKDIAELETLRLDIKKHAESSVKYQLFENSLSVIEYNSNKDFEKGAKEIEKIITLYEEHNFLMEHSIKGYISSLYNLANTYRNLGSYDEAILILNKLDHLSNNKLITGSKFLSSYIFFLSNNLRLLIYILKHQFNEAFDRVQLIKGNYSERKHNIEKQIYYEHLILITRICLEKKKYKEAIKYSNIIINDPTFKKRQDIQSYIRLLNLIIHFELNNNFSLDYFSLSTKNYLKRKKRLFKTEDLVIKFLMKYADKNLKSLQKINSNLNQLKTDPLEKVMFNLFDFQQWIENKINELSSNK